MKRRSFLKKAALTTAGSLSVPFILPSGRLFAATGERVVNHVVFVLFGGGIRNQESVDMQYLANQGLATEGNIMQNMLQGAAPSSNLVYQPWTPVLGTALSQQGTLFREVEYTSGPTGHYNGHTVAMTGNYTETGLNLNINPEFPTIFEYYRRHSDPAQSAINSWWISEGLGPYPSLNYSQHPSYGPAYGANYMRPASVFGAAGFNQLSNAVNYQPDDVARIHKIKAMLDQNFDLTGDALPGIQNTPEEREQIKAFYLELIDKISNGSLQVPTPGNDYNLLTGDLVALTGAWAILDEFQPELMVVNTTNLDICHSNFSQYVDFLHKADYGVGWLWNKIQNHPVLKDDTIMVCIPEHGRNLDFNNLSDQNGLRAYDHTGDVNSRRVFSLIVGPDDKVIQGQSLGSLGNPAAESIDIVPTIAHILGVHEHIPSYLLPGRILEEAFI
ncbi:MAG: hypothetical protein GYB31_18025 [Bacteroidetes bacterium]|nr:hypothetical protein [Bacteroidota bacterium]